MSQSCNAAAQGQGTGKQFSNPRVQCQFIVLWNTGIKLIIGPMSSAHSKRIHEYGKENAPSVLWVSTIQNQTPHTSLAFNFPFASFLLCIVTIPIIIPTFLTLASSNFFYSTKLWTEIELLDLKTVFLSLVLVLLHFKVDSSCNNVSLIRTAFVHARNSSEFGAKAAFKTSTSTFPSKEHVTRATLRIFSKFIWWCKALIE